MAASATAAEKEKATKTRKLKKEQDQDHAGRNTARNALDCERSARSTESDFPMVVRQRPFAKAKSKRFAHMQSNTTWLTRPPFACTVVVPAHVQDIPAGARGLVVLHTHGAWRQHDPTACTRHSCSEFHRARASRPEQAIEKTASLLATCRDKRLGH